MHKLVVTKYIFESPAEDSRFANLRFEIEIPFIPFIGLELFDGQWMCSPIESVCYCTDSGVFNCRCLKEIANEENTEDLSPESFFEYLITGHTDIGWKLIAVNKQINEYP